jgi:hypothetical protein
VVGYLPSKALGSIHSTLEVCYLKILTMRVVYNRTHPSAPPVKGCKTQWFHHHILALSVLTIRSTDLEGKLIIPLEINKHVTSVTP